jgi:hypothetical protein
MSHEPPKHVTPAQAGVHDHPMGSWIPAFAGMTKSGSVVMAKGLAALSGRQPGRITEQQAIVV